MKKNIKKPLSLSTQTVRSLQDVALEGVAGGARQLVTVTNCSAACDAQTMVYTQCWGPCYFPR